MKNLKVIQIIFCSLVICFISVFGFFTVINENIYSKQEGRSLTVFPDVNKKSFMDDKFYSELTNAYSDQLVFRSKFVSTYYHINQQRYIGNVVRGKEDQLFFAPLIVEDDKDYREDLKNFVNSDLNEMAKNISDMGAKFIFLSIPRKDVVMDEYLPNSYVNGKENYLDYIKIIEENISSDVHLIDAYDVFEKSNLTDAFYQTDHHVNIDGSYLIFQEIIDYINKDGKNIEVKPLEEEYIVYEKVVNGSINRNIGSTIKGRKEKLILVPKNDQVEYERYDSGRESERAVFGDTDHYGVYMGGDCAETVVKTNLKGKPKILYVGSSFTNILESLSVYKFRRVVSVDYRYNNTGKDLLSYIKENDIDYVVFIGSQSNNALDVNNLKMHLGL